MWVLHYMRSFHFFSEGTCSFTKRLHLRACWSWVDTWKREGTRSMNYWWWLRNPEVSSEKWCFLDPKWCSILLAWSLSWQNWPLKFKRTSPRRQWPRRWFLWAVCRTISSALSWIPSLMIFEIRFLFVVCRLSMCCCLTLRVFWDCWLQLVSTVTGDVHMQLSKKFWTGPFEQTPWSPKIKSKWVRARAVNQSILKPSRRARADPSWKGSVQKVLFKIS